MFQMRGLELKEGLSRLRVEMGFEPRQLVSDPGTPGLEASLSTSGLSYLACASPIRCQAEPRRRVVGRTGPRYVLTGLHGPSGEQAEGGSPFRASPSWADRESETPGGGLPSG